ncbi:hypothetical protein ABLB69_05885 [Xenorhabdus khoisanae]|uniref:hypothetical protein n=1 Tax=Xenorhabdus khoisanae TaxID=880157 RepID=UPI0032B7EEAA
MRHVNSLLAICLRDQGKLIGMGRVIGDGACFFHIVDIMVDPDYQLTAPSAQGMHCRLMPLLCSN